MPRLLRQRLHPDLVLLHTSLPEAGSVSLGVEVKVLPAAIEAANANGGLVIAQASQGMPVTYGDATIPLDRLDYLVETHDALAYRTAATRTTWRPTSDYGRPSSYPKTPITASFLLGSPQLYDWVDHNQRVQMLRTETTNHPGIIASYPNLVSINTAIEVDLFAQANACRVRGQVYSGIGGQTVFIVGALYSRGGQAIIALRSWHPKADTSTVVPLLTGPVTSFQAQLHHHRTGHRPDLGPGPGHAGPTHHRPRGTSLRPRQVARGRSADGSTVAMNAHSQRHRARTFDPVPGAAPCPTLSVFIRTTGHRHEQSR